jgi:2-phosphoglycerate kinase
MAISTRRSSSFTAMPETVVYNKRGHGLPYSKGLMAQSLSASGLSLELSWRLARCVEQRLDEGSERRIDVADLRLLTEEVLREEVGDDAVRRFHDWERLDRLDRPLIVMLAGTTGVGKSTLASLLAHRLGITRVIATDVIRQVLRAFFSYDLMPAVHYSAFEAGEAMDLLAGETTDPDIAGFAHQAESVGTGVAAIVDRACKEETPMVVEGVHLVPGVLGDDLRGRCVPVEAVLVVEDEELHRGHFSLRGGERPADRYLRRFEQIRKLQGYLVERAHSEGVAVIDVAGVDQGLARVMDLVLDAVGRVSSSDRS